MLSLVSLISVKLQKEKFGLVSARCTSCWLNVIPSALITVCIVFVFTFRNHQIPNPISLYLFTLFLYFCISRCCYVYILTIVWIFVHWYKARFSSLYHFFNLGVKIPQTAVSPVHFWNCLDPVVVPFLCTWKFMPLAYTSMYCCVATLLYLCLYFVCLIFRHSLIKYKYFSYYYFYNANRTCWGDWWKNWL